MLRNSLRSPTSGIFATYGGFLNATTYGGLLTFPLKHTQPRLNLIITTHILPIVMFEQTIQHFEIVPGVPVDWYTLERITDDETGLTFWDTQKATPPSDNRIPLDSIVIIAKPENIYVPTGITITDSGANFFLPTIYAKSSIQITKNSLYLLNFAHLFGQVNMHHETRPLSYQIQPTNQ